MLRDSSMIKTKEINTAKALTTKDPIIARYLRISQAEDDRKKFLKAPKGNLCTPSFANSVTCSTESFAFCTKE